MGGAIIVLTRGLGKPTYELSLSSCHGGVSERLVWRYVLKILSLEIRVCTVATLFW